MSRKIAVIKFGSSVLEDSHAIGAVVQELYQLVKHRYKVICVVSALGQTTERLIQDYEIAYGHAVEDPYHQDYAELLSYGEKIATKLVSAGLHKIGLSHYAYQCAPLQAVGTVLDASAISADVNGILDHLVTHDVVIVPGFIAHHLQQSVCLLGRGGSDYTAVYLAYATQAEACILVKDVNGIYDRDPNRYRSAQPFAALSYDDACYYSRQVMQEKALRLAKQHVIPVHIKSLRSDSGTYLGLTTQRHDDQTQHHKKPLRVGLLGLGTVGDCVYQQLAASSDFDVTGVAVRDLGKHLDKAMNLALLTDDLEQVIQSDCDVVIEVIGGIEPAFTCIKKAIVAGKSVITANKALIAKHGCYLRALAQKHHVILRYSAAVGGGIPVLEHIDQLRAAGTIQSVSGVINGTSNYILEGLIAGKRYDQVLTLAQQLGYAEAVPDADVKGDDAAQKIQLIAEHAFGRPPDNIEVSGIDTLDPLTLDTARAEGKRLRLIATCSLCDNQVIASVAVSIVDDEDPFYELPGTANRVLITTDNDHIFLNGLGAGAWPTAASVISDITAITADHQSGVTQLGRVAA